MVPWGGAAAVATALLCASSGLMPVSTWVVFKQFPLASAVPEGCAANRGDSTAAPVQLADVRQSLGGL